ncbi:DoxX family protein [Pleomorphomonas sp. NRK KF1]|uniref:DoxX family protein n=1 Tax=Pleomorphomonas sp. NRK KF1 TaxID=2943000 RepID=UPI002043D732|nr:DoxX family protein [Pleomorphomonas sp. NRK KF1]MCM5553088.1 DoxX family protein [Pleomorphomonas sp. NRK KF1]
MDSIKAPALLAGRILLSIIFITSGWGKITGYAGTAGYMEAMGVPSLLLPLVILTELGGGLAVLVGFQTRIAAFLLAGFCVVSGYLFHYKAISGAAGQEMMDMMNWLAFMKNVTIAGGFLTLLGAGAGALSVDAKLGKA